VSTIESLARILPGQDLEIVRVLLRASASDNAHHALRPGRRWHCRYSGLVSLLLVSPTGQTISVRRDVARYVQVSTRSQQS
jgi:hypothetical protein